MFLQEALGFSIYKLASITSVDADINSTCHPILAQPPWQNRGQVELLRLMEHHKLQEQEGLTLKR